MVGTGTGGDTQGYTRGTALSLSLATTGWACEAGGSQVGQACVQVEGKDERTAHQWGKGGARMAVNSVVVSSHFSPVPLGCMSMVANRPDEPYSDTGDQ
jgi:hypothetical protein